MALSNIFREPRRELTETGIGTAVFAVGAIPVAFLDHWVAMNVIQPSPGQTDLPIIVAAHVLAMLLCIMGAVAVAGLAVFIHFIGEEICDALQTAGIHLRPRKRPQ